MSEKIASHSNSEIASERRKSAVVSNIGANITAEYLTEYIANELKLDKSNVRVTPLRSTKRNTSSVQFRISTPESYFRALMSPDSWPGNVRIREYFFKPRSNDRQLLREDEATQRHNIIRQFFLEKSKTSNDAVLIQDNLEDASATYAPDNEHPNPNRSSTRDHIIQPCDRQHDGRFNNRAIVLDREQPLHDQIDENLLDNQVGFNPDRCDLSHISNRDADVTQPKGKALVLDRVESLHNQPDENLYDRQIEFIFDQCDPSEVPNQNTDITQSEGRATSTTRSSGTNPMRMQGNCSILPLLAKRLTIYYQNVRGLRTKTKEFKLSSTGCSVDIIALTETGLTASINDGDLFNKPL